jgi:hypothetical protein
VPSCKRADSGCDTRLSLLGTKHSGRIIDEVQIGCTAYEGHVMRHKIYLGLLLGVLVSMTACTKKAEENNDGNGTGNADGIGGRADPPAASAPAQGDVAMPGTSSPSSTPAAGSGTESSAAPASEPPRS